MTDKKIKISMIAAVANNYAIGRDNQLPWHAPDDLRYFKSVTLEKPVIMGRKTFESLGRPLPKRHNIVITRNVDFTTPHPNVTICASLEQALSVAKEKATQDGKDEIFIIGGAQIYEQGMVHADRLYLTYVDCDVPDADSFFPRLDLAKWQILSEEKQQPLAPQPSLCFTVYQRR